MTPPGTGAWNMALDEALAESVRQGGAPFLRFYTWAPATLSLGRFQDPTWGLKEDAQEVPRVRRLTGGGAIWHAEELTYSLGCAQHDLGTTGVKASFEILTSFLLQTWRSLGWDSHYAKDQRMGVLGRPTPACFSGTEEYDILVHGKKLGGNAQRRDRKTLFQHGSIPLALDHSLLSRIFQEEFAPDPSSITDLRTCGWNGTLEQLIPLLTREFQRCLGIEGIPDQPTNQEWEVASTLVSQRYGHQRWTETGDGVLRTPETTSSD